MKKVSFVLIAIMTAFFVSCMAVPDPTPAPSPTTAVADAPPIVVERPSPTPSVTRVVEGVETAVMPTAKSTHVPTYTPQPTQTASPTLIPTSPPKFQEVEAPPIPHDSFWAELEEAGYEILESTAVIGPKEYVYAAYLLRDPTSFDPGMWVSGPEACRLAIYRFNQSNGEFLRTFGAPGTVSICHFNWEKEWEWWSSGSDDPNLGIRNRAILGVSGDWSDINQNGFPEVGIYYNYCFNACLNYGIPDTRFYEIQSTSQVVEITANLPGVILPWELLTFPILDHIPVFEVRTPNKWDRLESPWIFTWDGIQFVDGTANYQSEYLSMAEETASKIREAFTESEHPKWHLRSIFTILLNLEKAGLREEGFNLFLELTDLQNWPNADATDIQLLYWIREQVEADYSSGSPFGYYLYNCSIDPSGMNCP